MNNKERNEAIIGLHKKHATMSNGQIAKRVGCSPAIVSGVLFREREKGTLSRTGIRSVGKRPGETRELEHEGRRRHEPAPALSLERSKEMIEAIASLVPHQCRWPLEIEGHFTFCSSKADEGSSYCGCHRAMSRGRRG